MAQVAGTHSTFQAKGLRENLADIISDISPEETPFISGSGRSSVDQVLFDWQTDKLDAPDPDNAHVQGDDISVFTPIQPTARIGNRTQISRKEFVISRTLEQVNKAGRNSEIARQTVRKGLALRRDLETIALGNQAAVAGDDATASRTGTLGAWVSTNTDFGTGGADPVLTSGMPSTARTDGTQRTFTQAMLQAVTESVWTNGGTLVNLLVGPLNKRIVSTFPGIVQRNFDISNADPRPTASIAAIDVFVDDFGTLRVIANRFQRERDAWLWDPEFTKIRELQPITTEELAKTGDGQKFMILTEWGLEVRNEAALGLVADLGA